MDIGDAVFVVNLLYHLACQKFSLQVGVQVIVVEACPVAAVLHTVVLVHSSQ